MVRSFRITPLRRFNVRARLLAVAVAGCYATAPAWAQVPTNPVVKNGTATFSQSGNVLTVTNSNGAIIHWDTFSIDKGYTTHFEQTSASSSVLNRVVTASPSLIYGTLSSNGKVWLINPNGILIGPGGVVNTAAFIASTLDVTNANFLAGKLTFEKTPGAADVVNQGTITTPSGGSVYLVGANVSNEAIITTPNGETILAAGETVNIVDTGTPGVKVEITGAKGNVTNIGQIVAEAGRIGMAGVLVRNSGTLDASGSIDKALKFVTEGGRIFLKASQDTYVDGNGRIVATGTKGGQVEVLGNRVAVMDNATIDASGTNGGGTILVGGDFQGKNPDIQNSTVTYFGKDATLKADTTDNGDGGKVIVWADNTTRAYGSISARGGANGGNGGFVETSGKGYLDFRASVDTSAPLGNVGTLLLDPTSINLVSNDSDSPDGTLSGGVFSTSGAPDNSIIGWNTIGNQLTSTDVVIQTSSEGLYGGNITVSGSPSSGTPLTISRSYIDSDGVARTFTSTTNSPTYNSSHNLSLLAEGSVDINASFGNSGTGAITIVAGWNGISQTSPQTVSYTSAHSAGIGNITFNNAILATNGAVTLKAADAVRVRAQSSYAGIDMTNGTLSITANKLLMQAGRDGSGQMPMARIASAGNQYFALGDSNNAGSLELDGSNYGYGGSANIEQFGAGGGQQFKIYGSGGSVLLQAGHGSETSSFACSEGACSGNGARIENHGSGTQEFDFVNGGGMTLIGGTAGTNNSANISSDGAQLIWSSGQSPINITLVGGTGGAMSGTKTFDNGAGIDSKTSQTIKAFGGMLTMIGGGNAATYGGAFLGAPVQRLSFGSAILVGGNSNVRDSDGFGAPVAIGNKNSANVVMDVGLLMIEGGSGTASPVGIGSLSGNATVDINASGGVFIDSGTSGVGIGSIGKAIAPGAAGGVYVAAGASVTGSAVMIGANNDVAVYGGIAATGGSVLPFSLAGLDVTPNATISGLNIYAGLGGSGNITLGPQSSLRGTPINLVANGGKVIDNRASAVTTATTGTIITAILSSTTGGTPPPPIVIPPPPTGGGTGSLAGGSGSVGGGDNEFGGSSGSSSGSGEGSGSSSGSGGKDKDKDNSGNSGNGNDNKPSGKKPVGRCNA